MLRKFTTFLTSFICLLHLILIVGCEKRPDVPELPNFDELAAIPEKPSESLSVHIYVDATLSMQGFTVPGTTHYSSIFTKLESAITTGWSHGKAEFYRFGIQVEQIFDRTTYLKAKTPDFYEDTDINLETRIQEVIDYDIKRIMGNEISNTTDEDQEGDINPDQEISEDRKVSHLAVIVTDLFQDQSDINLLVAQLKDKYIKNNLEVGLLGIRSQFDGIVYDMGHGQDPLPHKSEQGKPDTYRPFYLLVLGKYSDIYNYFEQLKKSDYPDAQGIIFSRYLINSLMSFDEAVIKEEGLNPNTFTDRSYSHLKQYAIVKKSEQTKIIANQKYFPIPYAMSFDLNMLEDSISAKHKRGDQTEVNHAAQNILKVTSSVIDNNQENELSVEFKLLRKSLPNINSVFLYEVTLKPTIDSFVAPVWCKSWDMGVDMNLKRDGSRTLNLVNFVRDLSKITAQTHNPIVGKYYFLIK